MTPSLDRARLTRAALALNARRGAGYLPPLLLMTDEQRLRDPVAAARALPKGAGIVLRHTEAQSRARLAVELRLVSEQRGLLLLIAADPELAARIGADGLHLPEARSGEAAHWKARHPAWVVTAAAHSARAVARAGRAGADAVLLAPVFATKSHAGRVPLGVFRARAIAAAAMLPVYALGGIHAASLARLADAPFVGAAAIEALLGGQN